MKECIGIVKDLTVTYGQMEAVKQVSFPIYTNEILAVIGPNGSGKTSTVECVEGLRKPSSGSIKLFGLDPFSDRKQIYQKLGIQLQEVDYPDKMKVKEICTLFSSFYENPADASLLLKQLGLETKANRCIQKLSGGEKQRLSILLALLPKPKLLILDELTTGLDPEARHGLLESLRWIKQQNIGILLVSHYLEEVEALADRILFLVKGEPVFHGTTKEFREYAKNILPPDQYNKSHSLEQLYLALSPEKTTFNLEGLL